MKDSRSHLYDERMKAVEKAMIAKSLHAGEIIKLKNVVGAGVGYKVTAKGPTDELSVVVAVERKLPKNQLSSADLVPSELDGVRTDVIETGRLRAFGPAQPGCSIAHAESTAGTFGCLVERDGERLILSNNHVLALINRGAIGDPILQPGPADGGTMDDQIGTLLDFIPIDFGDTAPDCPIAGSVAAALNKLAEWSGSSHRLQAKKLTEGVNRVDAALARPLSPDLVSSDILEIGVPTGTAEATLGTRVKKRGRTTGLTNGYIQTIEMTVQIDYDGPIATFYGQLMATPMSQPGDSGSAVLDQQNQVVGLLFAGSDRSTIINPIHEVLQALNVTIVTQ